MNKNRIKLLKRLINSYRLDLIRAKRLKDNTRLFMVREVAIKELAEIEVKIKQCRELLKLEK